MADNYTIQQLTLISDDEASSELEELLAPSKASLGFAPNMYRAMGNHPALLTDYLDGYATFRARSGFTPAEQEVVLLAISYSNDCHYCTAAHSMVAEKVSDVPAEVLAAIRSGSDLPDPKLATLHATATALTATKGRPDHTTVTDFLAAGYTEVDLLSIIQAISVKVISNYTNHLFGTPLDDAFAPYAR